MALHVRRDNGADLSHDIFSDSMAHASSDAARALLARAKALTPALKEPTAQANALRRLPPETAAAFRDTDIMRVLQPRKFGGAQGTYLDFTSIIETLAQSCGSSAWVYGVFGEHQWVVAQFSLQAQQEVWGADPKAVACASFVPAGRAEAVSGGFRVSGKFSFASGCDHAQWGILGSIVGNPSGSPTVYDFLVPIAELTIDDDWQVFGLEGTGSKTLVAENVFVPVHRSMLHADLLRGRAPGHNVHTDFTLTRAPRSLFAALTLVSTLLGLSRRAVDLFAESLRAGRASRGVRLAEIESIQLKLAECAMEADTARMLIRTTCVENQPLMESQPEISVERVALTRRNIAYATRLARQSVERAFAASGGAIYQTSPMHTVFRDMQAGASHAFLHWEVSGAPYARLRLGLPHGSPFL
ncbi:MAG: acyl-CoA dehydrogenase family protein [Burkholderiales bacterium]